jgi:hypothetical protein
LCSLSRRSLNEAERVWAFSSQVASATNGHADIARLPLSDKGETKMLLIIILLVLIFGFGYGGYRVGPGWGYYGGGGLSMILVIVLILLLLRVI